MTRQEGKDIAEQMSDEEKKALKNTITISSFGCLGFLILIVIILGLLVKLFTTIAF